MAQNLGIADVARHLKLSTTQVEALETGDFQRLPGAVFVRGFLRNYARLLKLDADALLKLVSADLPREELSPPAPPSQEIPFPSAAPRRWPAYAFALGALVVALAAYEFFPSGSEPAKAPVAEAPGAPAPQGAPGAPATDAAAGPPETASPAAPSDGGARPAPERPGEPAAARQPAGAVTGEGPQATMPVATNAAPAQDTQPAAKSAAREEEPAPGERQVYMVFEKASWVEIRDRSGKAIFSQLNPPGTEQRVNGRPPLAVVVGNAHGVRLTYDERPVNLALHTKVDVARLTLQ